MYIKVKNIIKAIIITICTFILLSTTINAQELANPIFITTTNVNLRPSPDVYGQRITLIYTGTEVEVIDFRDGVWFAVYVNGLEGYMYAEFLESAVPTTPIDNNVTPPQIEEAIEPEVEVPFELESVYEPEPVFEPEQVYEPEPELEAELETIQEETIQEITEDCPSCCTLPYQPQEYDIEEPAELQFYITTSRLNLRTAPGTNAPRYTLVNQGRRVIVTDYRDGEWYAVIYNGRAGYMYAQFLMQEPEPGSTAHLATPGQVEMLPWSTVSSILPQNTPFTVVDVRTGLSWQKISFSHGNHADVFPATQEDTETFRRAVGGSWTWDPRPILVIFNGRTVAASTSAMPHAGGGNRNNGMNGHVCIHFYGSRTHNGNRSHERDHQAAVREAFNSVR